MLMQIPPLDVAPHPKIIVDDMSTSLCIFIFVIYKRLYEII